MAPVITKLNTGEIMVSVTIAADDASKICAEMHDVANRGGNSQCFALQAILSAARTLLDQSFNACVQKAAVDQQIADLQTVKQQISPDLPVNL